MFDIQNIFDSEAEFDDRFGWVQEIYILVDIIQGSGCRRTVVFPCWLNYLKCQAVPFTTATKSVISNENKKLSKLIKCGKLICIADVSMFLMCKQGIVQAMGTLAKLFPVITWHVAIANSTD